MSDLATLPKETANVTDREGTKAAQAFADFVALGPSRSLRKLAARYVEQGRYRTETTAFNILGRWSGEHHWQDRLKEMALSRADEANEYRANTWVAITGEYHRRIVEDQAMRKTLKIESLNSVYDRVKPDTPSESGSSGPQITVNFAFVEMTRPQ